MIKKKGKWKTIFTLEALIGVNMNAVSVSESITIRIHNVMNKWVLYFGTPCMIASISCDSCDSSSISGHVSRSIHNEFQEVFNL